jgi:hypothetical protein
MVPSPPTTRWRSHHAASLLPAILLAVLLAATGAMVRPAAPALGRDLASDLHMHYMDQYLGNASDNVDCGPASVAMVVDAFGKRPAGTSDAGLVAAIRRSTGVPSSIGTIYDDLQRALRAYGLSYSLVPSSMAGEPDAELQVMRDAINAGNLVIPLVHGATLGRSERYGDHWIVLTGFDGGNAHILDPDNQPARFGGWVRGGDITMSTSLLGQAMMQAQPGPYGLIVYAPGNRPPLQAGAAHISGTDGDGAFLRSSAGIGDNKLTLLTEGTAVTISGPLPGSNADGHTWVSVSANGQQGYVATDYLSPN